MLCIVYENCSLADREKPKYRISFHFTASVWILWYYCCAKSLTDCKQTANRLQTWRALSKVLNSTNCFWVSSLLVKITEKDGPATRKRAHREVPSPISHDRCTRFDKNCSFFKGTLWWYAILYDIILYFTITLLFFKCTPNTMTTVGVSFERQCWFH